MFTLYTEAEAKLLSTNDSKMEQNQSVHEDVVCKPCRWITTMYERRRTRYMMYILALTFLFGVIYLGYFCEDRVCALSPGSGTPAPHYHSQIDAYLKGSLIHNDFEVTDLKRDYDFEPEGKGVIVFLHIQKTGGTTFGRHLVKDLNIPCQCVKGRKRCDCENDKNQIWLFSRYSVGWPCGLHADWTELTNCAEGVLESRDGEPRSRRYYYITILRDPMARFLSEWTHVQRGATWLSAKLKCGGREASLTEVPFCFEGEDWRGVSLDEFMACSSNLAINRQSRMLANLSLVSCYNTSAMSQEKRNSIILKSAKDNLKNMAFFGLTEFQADTQYMFERTFGLKFLTDFEQFNRTHATSKRTDITDEQKKGIIDLNTLDIQLYQYAKDLFLQRLRHMRAEDARMGMSGATAKDGNFNDIHKYDHEELDENYEEEEDDYKAS